MKNDYTEILVIIDRSGSMQTIANDTIGGYNAFIADQKKVPGDAKLTTILFSTAHEIFEDRVDLQKANTLSSLIYVPSGGTALLDAMSFAINSIKDKQASLQDFEKTDKVIVLTITDGEENSSHKTSKNDIKKLIEEQTALGWKFDFLSADMNAINEATRSYGISAINTMSFAPDSIGVSTAYMSMHNSAKNYRIKDIKDTDTK